MKHKIVTIQMKGSGQYFHLVPFASQHFWKWKQCIRFLVCILSAFGSKENEHGQILCASFCLIFFLSDHYNTYVASLMIDYLCDTGRDFSSAVKNPAGQWKSDRVSFKYCYGGSKKFR